MPPSSCQGDCGFLLGLKSIASLLPFSGAIGRTLAHPAENPKSPQKSRNLLTNRGLRLEILEAEEGIEPSNDGFANHCLTTWLLRRCAWRGGEGLRAGRVGVNARVIGNCGVEGGQGVVDFRLGGAERRHEDEGVENRPGEESVFPRGEADGLTGS